MVYKIPELLGLAGKAEGVVSHEQVKPGLPAERVRLEAFPGFLLRDII